MHCRNFYHEFSGISARCRHHLSIYIACNYVTLTCHLLVLHKNLVAKFNYSSPFHIRSSLHGCILLCPSLWRTTKISIPLWKQEHPLLHNSTPITDLLIRLRLGGTMFAMDEWDVDEISLHTKASPSADDIADMKKKADITSDRMFLGAFANAYSRPVIDAKISLMAIRTYL